MQTPAGRPSNPDRSGTCWYEVRVQGHLDPRWAAWVDGLSLTREGDGTTVLRGPADQAALHGLLQKVRDAGLPLVSVVTTAPREAEGPSEGERP